MDPQGTKTARESDSHVLFRCARCGVESLERTCFVIPERYGRPPHDTRCLTCEQRRVEPNAARGIAAVAVSLFWPLFILAGSERGSQILELSAIVLTFLLYPVAIVAHELGHAGAAWLLRLEIGGVAIGYGRRILQFELGGLPVQIHAWPLSGRVYLGSRTAHVLRSRLWIATLMGPATNAIFVALTARYWAVLEPITGPTALALWLIVNFLLLILSLVPQRTAVFGQPYRSDGLALLEIPRATSTQLAPYLIAAPLMRAWCRLQTDDFPGARVWAEDAVARAPDSGPALVILSACLVSLHEYRAASSLLTPALGVLPAQEPAIRAAVWNNLAVALFLPNALDESTHLDVLQADRRSADAYGMYPCVLEYRSTRALTLAATGSADKALELLKYRHYDTGTARQRGHREVARAFALQKLGRKEDARERAKAAVKLDPPNADLLRLLGASLSSS